MERFSQLKKGYNSKNNWWILPYIQLDIHFTIIFVPVYKIWIQYTNRFKRYQMETIFQLFFNIDKGP